MDAPAVSPAEVCPEAPEAATLEQEPEKPAGIAEAETTHDAYSLVIDAVLKLLGEPQADEWLAGKMCVRVAQVKDWLERGVSEGKIVKLKKPVRYVAHTPTLFNMAAQHQEADVFAQLMPDIWFTADFHLGHQNIIRYCNRPFPTVSEMDDEILVRMNACVAEADTLFFLGDFCRGTGKEALAYRRRIRCDLQGTA